MAYRMYDGIPGVKSMKNMKIRNKMMSILATYSPSLRPQDARSEILRQPDPKAPGNLCLAVAHATTETQGL